MPTESQTPRLRPVRALLNGALAWVLGFVLYMLPGFGIGFKMGYDLNMQGLDREEVSRQIKVAVEQFYHGNVVVGLGAACVISLLLYWRAHVSSRDAGAFATRRGLLVASLPVLLEILWSLRSHVGYVEGISVVMYIAVAIAGARRGASVGAAPQPKAS